MVFPFLFFIRLHYPAAPMTLTIFIVTVGLVIGYSWQDAKAPNLSNAGKFALRIYTAIDATITLIDFDREGY